MRLLKLIPDNTNIGFVRLRAWAFGLTALLTLAAAVLVGVRGLNFGVDFKGASLAGADLSGARLDRADMSQANLEGVIVRDTCFLANTKWPDGFDAIGAGAKLCK